MGCAPKEILIQKVLMFKVSIWKSETSMPEATNLIELSKVFHIDLNELMNGEKNTTPQSNQRTPFKIRVIVGVVVVMVALTSVYALTKINHTAKQVQGLYLDLERVNAWLSEMSNALNQSHVVPDKTVFHEAQSDLVALDYDRMEMSVRVSFALKTFTSGQDVQVAVNDILHDAQPNELGVFEGILTVPMTNDVMVDVYIQDESTTHSYSMTESPGLVNQYRLQIGIDDIDTVKDEYVLYRSIMLPAGFDSNDHKVVMEGNGFKHSGHHYHDIRYILTNAQDELIISQTYHPNGSHNEDEDRLMRLLKEEMIENESYTLHVEYLIDDLVFVSYPAGNLAVDMFGLRYEAIDTYDMRVTPITPSY